MSKTYLFVMESNAIVRSADVSATNIADRVAWERVKSRNPSVCRVTAQLNLRSIESKIIRLVVDNEIEC